MNSSFLRAAALLVCVVAPSAAQTSLSIQSANPGSCSFTVSVAGAAATDTVGVVIAGMSPTPQLVGGVDRLTFPSPQALRGGDAIDVLLNRRSVAHTTVPGGRADSATPCSTASSAPAANARADEDPFQVSGYLGMVYDNFAPDSIGRYRNPGAKTTKSQYLFGFDFEYRLLGKPTGTFQFWLAGETMHGVRSADISCAGDNAPPVCDDAPEKTKDKARYILANASSLEAFLAPRLEFARFQTSYASSASLYLGARVGIISLEDSPTDFRTTRGLVGLTMHGGDYAGSFIEIGYGRNELLSWRANRVLVDGLLSYNLGLGGIPMVGDLLDNKMRFFVEATVDNDLGHGADAFRSFIGFDFSPRGIFR